MSGGRRTQFCPTAVRDLYIAFKYKTVYSQCFDSEPQCACHLTDATAHHVTSLFSISLQDSNFSSFYYLCVHMWYAYLHACFCMWCVWKGVCICVCAYRSSSEVDVWNCPPSDCTSLSFAELGSPSQIQSSPVWLV